MTREVWAVLPYTMYLQPLVEVMVRQIVYELEGDDQAQDAGISIHFETTFNDLLAVSYKGLEEAVLRRVESMRDDPRVTDFEMNNVGVGEVRIVRPGGNPLCLFIAAMYPLDQPNAMDEVKKLAKRAIELLGGQPAYLDDTRIVRLQTE